MSVPLKSRTASKLEKACETLKAEQPDSCSIRYEALDLTNSSAEDIKAMLQRCAAAFGRVDAVFANAGFGESRLVVDPDPSQNNLAEKDRSATNLNLLRPLKTRSHLFNSLFICVICVAWCSYLEYLVKLNTLGTLRTVLAASDVMVQDGNGGRICLVSSAAGLISTPGYAFYSATKFSQRGLVEFATLWS